MEPALSDESLLKLLGERLARLRLARNLTQAQLAEQAGISVRTLQRLEQGEAATQLSGFVRVCRVLGLIERFDMLIPELPPSPMELLKLQGRQRRRATGRKLVTQPRKKWTWGESS